MGKPGHPQRLKKFFELVKFEHTIFALPFAYMGMLAAQKSWPGWWTFIWITLAMVGARTAGMTLNRLIDRAIDGKNPRTRDRGLVTGEVKPLQAWALAAASLAVFFFSAWQLNPLCFKLSPLALLFLVGYHYVKRFSFLCHWTLGLTLGIAPVGGWFAASGYTDWRPFVLGLAVAFWVAGFDILYSLQDIDFDSVHKLHSMPARFGLKAALKASEYCHAATVVFLIIFAAVVPFGLLFAVGVVIAAALLWFEHRIVGDGDLSHINAAFFTVNGWIGILLLVFTILDIV